MDNTILVLHGLAGVSGQYHIGIWYCGCLWTIPYWYCTVLRVLVDNCFGTPTFSCSCCATSVLPDVPSAMLGNIMQYHIIQYHTLQYTASPGSPQRKQCFSKCTHSDSHLLNLSDPTDAHMRKKINA